MNTNVVEAFCTFGVVMLLGFLFLHIVWDVQNFGHQLFQHLEAIQTAIEHVCKP